MIDNFKFSDEQKILLIKSFDNIKTLANNFSKNMNKIIKERIKPIVDRIKALLKKIRMKVKHKIVKIIPVNLHIGINKPKMINCRSNC